MSSGDSESGGVQTKMFLKSNQSKIFHQEYLENTGLECGAVMVFQQESQIH